MNIFSSIKKLFEIRFVRYFAGFATVLLAGSLTLGFVFDTQKKQTLSSQSLDEQQKKEIFASLQTFGNAYALFGETDFKLNLLDEEFLTNTVKNIFKITGKPILSPFLLTNIDLTLIERLRKQFSPKKSNLGSKILTRDVEKHFNDRNNIKTLKSLIENLIQQSKQKDLLKLVFPTLISNDNLRPIIYKQIQNIYQNFFSPNFVQSIKEIQNWIVKGNYAQLLVSIIKLFKSTNFQNTVQGKTQLLLNYFALLKNLSLALDDPIKSFLNTHFSSNKTDVIVQKLVDDQNYRQEIETKLNSLDRNQRLDLELRKHIFRIVAHQFVQQFVKELFFNTKKPGTLLLMDATVSIEQLVQVLIENNKIESLGRLFFSLLFFDYLISKNETIPQTFHQFLDAFVSFANNFNFRSVSLGYLVHYLNLELRKLFLIDDPNQPNKPSNQRLAKQIREELMKKTAQELRNDLKNWINIAQTNSAFFQKGSQTLISHQRGTLEQVKAWLDNDDPFWVDEKKPELITLYIRLLEKSWAYVALTEVLQKDPNNLLTKLGGNFLTLLLQSMKDQFFGKNLSILKSAKFLTQNWKLSQLSSIDSFDDQKAKAETKLREDINVHLQSFLNQYQTTITNFEQWLNGQASPIFKPNTSSADFNPLLQLHNVLKSIIKWLEFLWAELLSKLPFLNFNFLLVLVTKLFFADSRIGKLISDFADFGKNENIFHFALLFFQLTNQLLGSFAKLPLSWTKLPPSINRKTVEKLFQDLGYDQQLAKQKGQPLFKANSFLVRFFQILSNADNLLEKEKGFFFFLQNKILGQNGFFNFALDRINNYLHNNFYLFLKNNNWNYSQKQIEHWDDVFNQGNNKPLIVKYHAQLKSSQFNDVTYRFVWEITINNDDQEVKLVKMERLMES